jgi:catechol 2,3-dioxygenase-like lactoylglutathione lyase family enzyme
MPVTSGFNHVATLTSDMDRTVDFYKSAFGADVLFEMDAREDHPRMVILDLGAGAALNVFETAAEEIIGDRRRQGARGAIDHYALAVDSLETLESLRDRLVGAGAEIGEIQQLGAEWSLFFRDPDGMELEVCCSAD